MKKVFLTLLILAFAGSAFAATTINGEQSLGSSGTKFTPSTKVDLSVISTITAYTATSFHQAGNRGYATTQDVGIAESDNEITSITSAGDTAGTMPADYSL